MNNHFLRSCIAIALMFAVQIGWAQDSYQAAKVTLKGQIVDQDSELPLEFATISVYRSLDSTLVEGISTDLDGNFQFQLSTGNYYMQVNYIAYQTKTISDVAVNGDQPMMDMGKIMLAESSTMLEEVEVVAEKSQMQLQLDKRVFNVGKDLANAGLNAAEMLDNIPSITVDIEGAVSLRGSANVRILLDGKPSGLVLGSENALQQLDGNMIERVEVITNPSARYDAEGEVGIINIILKKGKNQGFNGSFTLNTGVPANLGGSYNLNYRSKSFNFFSSFGLRYDENVGGGSNYQESTRSGMLTVFESDSDRRRKRFSGNFRGGASWFLSPTSTLTGSVLLRKSDGENDNVTTYRDLDQDFNLVSTTVRDNDENDDGSNVEFGLSYEKTFSSRDHKLNIDARWIDEEDREQGNFNEFIVGSTDAPILQRTDNIEKERNGWFSADYVQPIGEEGQFEVGLRATLREIDNDYFLEEQDETGNFVVLPNFDDQLKFTENVYAGYTMYGNKIGSFSYQFGLRAEYTDLSTFLVISEDRNDRDFFNLFPTAHFSYEITEEDQIQLSYSRRISRPRFWFLLPFPSFDDIRNNFQGNPNLNPEFSNSMELGYLKYWEKGSLLSSIYYRHRTGVISRITVINQDGTTTRMPVNLNTQDAYGIELNFNQDITKKWNFNFNWNFFREITNGSFEGIALDNDAVTWTSRAITKFEVLKGVDAQISFNYRAPRLTAQGRNRSVYNLDLGASTDLLKGKGTITLSVRDLFNTRFRRSIVEEPDFFSESRFQWRGRQARLAFTYRLNQKKRRGGRGDRGGDFGGDGEF